MKTNLISIFRKNLNQIEKLSNETLITRGIAQGLIQYNSKRKSKNNFVINFESIIFLTLNNRLRVLKV
jgi:hypothetical protein